MKNLLNQENTKDPIILGFLKNDTAILQNIYTKVFPKVQTYVVQNNGSKAQAKDIYQEAFVACWQNVRAAKFSDGAKIEAYIYSISKNKWIDVLRSSQFKKTQRSSAIEFEQEVVTDVLEENGGSERRKKTLQEALKAVGGDCEEVLEWYYFERKSIDQIAKTLGIEGASARNKKYRCMEKLRNLVLKQIG